MSNVQLILGLERVFEITIAGSTMPKKTLSLKMQGAVEKLVIRFQNFLVCFESLRSNPSKVIRDREFT